MGTLSQRIHVDGPLPVREAVRIVSRLARAIEILHAAGTTHGRVSPDAIVVTGKLLASARLLRPTTAPENMLFRSPERAPMDSPSREDDIYAVAHVLFFLVTGKKLGREDRAPPMAVFGIEDEVLETLLDDALSRDLEARPADLASLRRDLDAWLYAEGATIDEPLPFDDDERRRAIDLSALPPPPVISIPGIRFSKSARGIPELYTTNDEDMTVPRGQKPPVRVPSRPGSEDDLEDFRKTLPEGAPTAKLDGAPSSPSSSPPPDATAKAPPRIVPPKLPQKSKLSLPGVAKDPESAKSTTEPTEKPHQALRGLPVGETSDVEIELDIDPDEAPRRRSHFWKLPVSLLVIASLGVSAFIVRNQPWASPHRDALLSVLQRRGLPFEWLESTDAPFAELPEGQAASDGASAIPSSANSPGSDVEARVEAEPEPTLAAPAAASLAPPPAPSASSGTSPSAAAPPEPKPFDAVAISSCMAAALPSDSFVETPDLSALCLEPNPVVGAAKIREALVRAGMSRPVTGGMKEWALLGFYEVPGFAVIQRECCPTPITPAVPASPASCPISIQTAVDAYLATWPPDDGSVAKGNHLMEKALWCVVSAEAELRFGDHLPPGGGEGTAMKIVVKRLMSRAKP